MNFEQIVALLQSNQMTGHLSDTLHINILHHELEKYLFHNQPTDDVVECNLGLRYDNDNEFHNDVIFKHSLLKSSDVIGQLIMKEFDAEVMNSQEFASLVYEYLENEEHRYCKLDVNFNIIKEAIDNDDTLREQLKEWFVDNASNHYSDIDDITNCTLLTHQYRQTENFDERMLKRLKMYTIACEEMESIQEHFLKANITDEEHIAAFSEFIHNRSFYNEDMYDKYWFTIYDLYVIFSELLDEETVKEDKSSTDDETLAELDEDESD